MKGNEKVIATLNNLLSEELTAISQYMVHSEMCENWGYAKLHKNIEERAVNEMKHAEKLIARILFLDGMPIVSSLKKISIGAEIPAQFDNDLAAEIGAVQGYNEGARLAAELGDNGSRELMLSILTDEEAHVDWLESQIGQVKLMGLQTYLVEWIG